MKQRDLEGIKALFAPDATVTSYWGLVQKGTDEIARHYAVAFGSDVISPTPGPLIVEGDRCAVEIAVDMDDGPWRVSDFFVVRTDGRVESLVVYRIFGEEPDTWQHRRADG